jgi:hypothetical protein
MMRLGQVTGLGQGHTRGGGASMQTDDRQRHVEISHVNGLSIPCPIVECLAAFVDQALFASLAVAAAAAAAVCLQCCPGQPGFGEQLCWPDAVTASYWQEAAGHRRRVCARG